MSRSATFSTRIDRRNLCAVGSMELLGRIWNCWCQTPYRDGDMWSHLTHAMEITEQGHAPDRTLCGIKWTGETGMVTLKDEPMWQPGCQRCLKVLVKRGILLPNAEVSDQRGAHSLHPVVRRHRSWWVKERHNPQLGTYHVACGQMSKTVARKHEDCKYGYNIMHPFDTEKEYNAHLEYLREKGERVQ